MDRQAVAVPVVVRSPDYLDQGLFFRSASRPNRLVVRAPYQQLS
jgi:hypothetical protein